VITAVIQTCDWCGKEERSKGMHVPPGWFIIDTRAGAEPGVNGFGWNMCTIDCLLDMLDEWSAGKNPMPHGMSEKSQVIHKHDHEEDVAMIARASANRRR